jgi:hypothetical protein
VEEEEIDEITDLSPEEAAETIATDVRELIAFYETVQVSGAGVVIYTS